MGFLALHIWHLQNGTSKTDYITIGKEYLDSKLWAYKTTRYNNSACKMVTI